MAAHQNFDLDKLGSTARFEQLCYALLLHYFGPHVVPYGALGRDGGIDARLDGLPDNYTTLDGVSLLYGNKKIKKPGFWVFQAKYHQYPYKNTIAITDLISEWKSWRKRKPKPDYFIFLTNVVLTPKGHKEFIKKIKKPTPFKAFDYWDGEKIATLIASNAAIRSSFFPNCEDHGFKLDKILDEVTNKKAKSKKSKKKKKKNKPKAKNKTKAKSYLSSVEDLAKFEGAFAAANTEIVNRFSSFSGAVPVGWKTAEVKSPQSGIIQLAKEGKELVFKLIEASKSQSVIVKVWEKFLGEQADKGDTILKIAYDPDDEELVKVIQSSMFSVQPGDTNLRANIDKKIRNTAQNAIKALRDSDSFAADETLRELFRLRSEYIEARKTFGVGFYPNSRRLGRLTFGWSFISVWDNAFERICDILLAQTQPDNLYRLVANIPASLAKSAIDNRLPVDEIISELNALVILLFKAQERQTDRLTTLLFTNLNEVYEHFHDLRHRLEGLDDAKWAFGVAQALCDFAADIAKFSLTKKMNIDLDYANILFGLATGIHYSQINIPQGNNWLDAYKKLQDIDKENSQLQQEMQFAIGSYSWFLARQGRTDLAQVAANKLRGLSIKDTVRFYEKGHSLRRWYAWWFHPEGKRAVWSSTVDHDIREALILRLSLDIPKEEDLVELSLLESEGAVDSFLKSVEDNYKKIKDLKVEPIVDLPIIQKAFKQARDIVEKKRLESIRINTNLSKEKIEETERTFTNFLNQHDPKGSLHQIKVDNTPEFKPSHYVGVYQITSKEWFLKDDGYSSFSVSGLGSGWAEAIVRGRESLLSKKLNEVAKAKSIKIENLKSILKDIKDNYNDDFVMLIHSISIPWQLKHEFFKNDFQAKNGEKKFKPGQVGRIGEVDIYSGRSLKKGQIAIFPKDTFDWITQGICTVPRISLIDPETDEGKRIKEKNPSMDTNLKVVIEARELGTMECSTEKLKLGNLWQVKADDEDLL